MTMPKPARPADHGWDDRSDRAGRPAVPGSLPIRLAEAALRNPVTTGGVVVSVLMIVVTVANAVANQPARHPHPMFETRSIARSDDRAAPTGSVAPVGTQAPAAHSPASGVPTVMPRPKPVSALEDTLVRDLQTALADRGFYAGPVDGVVGPATAEAIRACERRLGTTPTGEPSELLLAALRAAPTLAAAPVVPATPAPVAPTAKVAGPPAQPAPKAAAAARAPAPAPAPARQTGATQPTTSATPPMRVAAVADAVAYPAESADYVEIDAPVTTGSIRRAAREPLAQGGDERLQKMQRALIAAGYGPLKADGKWDDHSTSAVRRYEADRGWTVTGKPSDKLVWDLMARGAQARR